MASVLGELAASGDEFKKSEVSVLFFETRSSRTLKGALAFLFVDVPRFSRAARHSDVIHFHVSKRGSLYRKFLLFLIARITGKRTIFHLHSGHFERFIQQSDRLTRRCAAMFINRADCVIAVSTSIAAWLQPWRPNGTIDVVGNMARDAEHAAPNDVTPSSAAPYIAFAGLLSEAKGLDDLLRAVAHLSKKGRAVEVRIAGSGDQRHWMRVAEAYGVAGQAVFVGWLTGEEKLSFYKGARVFCMPSHFESFGIATLEAMFCGVPVVGTRLGGFLDLVEDGVSGYLVEAGDAQALAEALETLLDDPGLCLEMGAAGLAKAKMGYRMASIVKRYVDCYRNITNPAGTNQ
jgi:glycosyltransferase involved in cell wall biosynthesis